MFILKPFKSSLFGKDDVRTVEEVVSETRLVDKGIEDLKRFSRNAPSFEPERRRFLKHVAVLAGIFVIVQHLNGCATMHGPEVMYPPGAPLIASDYLDNTGFDGGRRSSKPRRKGPHNGIDIDVLDGHPVLVAADGIVFRSHWNNDAGYRIVIEHGRDMDGKWLRTVYLHNSRNLVQQGQKVSRGQKIAESGRTGSESGDYPHLHFGVYVGPTKEYSSEWRDDDPHKYWMGSPYRIACFDPKITYSNLPVKFIYPVECKR